MSKKSHPVQTVPPESLQMPLTGADSHAHLDAHHYEDTEVRAVLERAEAAGVATIGNVFLSVADWERDRARFDAYPGVFFLLGIHPTDAMHFSSAVGESMRCAFAEDMRLRAVGEIGLDFYWKECPPEIQIPVFIAQLRLARDLKLPVVIHSRDAFDQTVAILRDEGFHGYPLLWHCFGGTRDQAQYLVDAGWHVSIPGPVTFPANDGLRAALAVIPEDRILAETDCPYLAPVPYRGKRNEPAFTVFTVSAMAEALKVPAATLWTRCGENTRRFFRLQQDQGCPPHTPEPQ